MKRLVIKPQAASDLRAGRRWNEGQRAGLGDEFLEAAEELFQRLRQRPELYAEIGQGVRRCLLPRFPYHVYYRLREDRVVVLTVLHSKRHPDTWRLRI